MGPSFVAPAPPARSAQERRLATAVSFHGESGRVTGLGECDDETVTLTLLGRAGAARGDERLDHLVEPGQEDGHVLRVLLPQHGGVGDSAHHERHRARREPGRREQTFVRRIHPERHAATPPDGAVENLPQLGGNSQPKVDSVFGTSFVLPGRVFTS